jgi:hypothetical protein
VNEFNEVKSKIDQLTKENETLKRKFPEYEGRVAQLSQ